MGFGVFFHSRIAGRAARGLGFGVWGSVRSVGAAIGRWDPAFESSPPCSRTLSGEPLLLSLRDPKARV